MADDLVFKADLDDKDVLKALNRIEREIDDTARDADRSFKKIDTSVQKTGVSFDKMALAVGGAVGTIGLAASVIKEYTDKALDAANADFALASSASAANREFGAIVGTADSWRRTIEQLSDETKIYSEQELTAATTRLIDMTKRLGLTEEQMVEVLRRTADLAAGKTDLEGAIERTTAALRGEAESAEFLGLSLSETQVKAYAEAQGLLFKELSDSEKAQLRYQLLLQQTNQIQGRAAQFAETAAGAEAKLNAQLEDQAVLLGEQLLPLRQGYSEAVGLLVEETEEGGSVITNVLAAILASYLAFGATAKTVIDAEIERWKSYAGVIGAAWEAIRTGENPLDAILDQIREGGEAATKGGAAILNYADTWTEAFNQVRDAWQQQLEVPDDLADTPFVPTPTGGADAGDLTDEQADALQKALDRLSDIERDAGRDRLDILIDAERKRLDVLEDFADKRVDLARKNLQKIDDIERELSRDFTDINRDIARERISIDKKLAQDKLKVEENYQTTLRQIRSRFEDDADEAARSRDAVTLLRLQRQRDRQLQEARETRQDETQDAVQQADTRRAELQTKLEEQREDAQIAYQRRLEDQRIALQREEEALRIAEERKSEELRQELDRRLRDAQVSYNRKLTDLKASLSEEVAALLEAEQEKTAILRREAAARSSIYQQQIDEAMQNRFTVPEYLRSPGRQYGGPVGAGQTVVTGERGPELFRPSVAGNVIPLRPGIMNALSSPNLTTTNITNYSPNVNQSMLDPASMSAMARTIARNEAINVIRGIISG